MKLAQTRAQVRAVSRSRQGPAFCVRRACMHIQCLGGLTPDPRPVSSSNTNKLLGLGYTYGMALLALTSGRLLFVGFREKGGKALHLATTGHSQEGLHPAHAL
jgi:hypothetical protein